MLTKGRQKKHFNAEWNSMRSYLQSYYSAQNQEGLHGFRVQVKKIKAMLLFLQNKPANKQMKALQTIFKHAGRIRSAYINLQLIRRYHLTNMTFENEQKKVLEQESQSFFQKYKKQIRTLKKIYPALVGGFHDLDDQSVVKLYKKSLKSLSRFFTALNFSADKLHQHRKKIKNLLYLYEVLPDPLVNKLQLNTAYLDKFQDKIGKWHDVTSAIKLLEMEEYADKKIMTALYRQSRSKLASTLSLADDFANSSCAKASHRR